MLRLSLIALCFCSLVASAQYPLIEHPISTQAEEGFSSCQDTIKILQRMEPYDLGVVLPEWAPIVNDSFVAVIEGSVMFDTRDGRKGPHVSHEDFPFFHYSHDLNFNLLPDVTDDNRYTNFLPYLVYKRDGNQRDTALRNNMHVEWETGLGVNNRINPFRRLNDAGTSAGFATAGHKTGDVIWNWPGINDHAHVEGHYIWDRGHPPAKAEIHPARFMAFTRQLPEFINVSDGSRKVCTRVDIFGNGDGGALKNNRSDVPGFVEKTMMKSKDYEYLVTHHIPRPSSTAVLRHFVHKRPGDTFTDDELVDVVNDSVVKVLIPWKWENVSDTAVYARTIYLYWDEKLGVSEADSFDLYRVKLTQLQFKKLSERASKASFRIYVNVGNDWIFLNDFHGKNGKVLSKGLGHTRKKTWALNNEFNVCLPRGKQFRVFMCGYEVDGIDLLTGDLLNQKSPCDKSVKSFFRKRIFSIKNMLLKGCMDDNLGEISQLFSADNLLRYNRITDSPDEGENEDPCPFSEYPLKDRVFLSYTIEKIN